MQHTRPPHAQVFPKIIFKNFFTGEYSREARDIFNTFSAYTEAHPLCSRCGGSVCPVWCYHVNPSYICTDARVYQDLRTLQSCLRAFIAVCSSFSLKQENLYSERPFAYLISTLLMPKLIQMNELVSRAIVLSTAMCRPERIDYIQTSLQPEIQDFVQAVIPVRTITPPPRALAPEEFVEDKREKTNSKPP